jgi:hypothetical protein
MQWSIRIYEGGTTFLHGLLWFTGLLFLSGHIAASAVQAGYHLTNVWSHADWIVAMDLGHMGWQELLALASIPSGLLALYSIGTAGRPASISGSAGEDSGAGALRAWLAARSRANARFDKQT